MSEPAPTVPVSRPEADGDEIRRFDAMPDTTPKEPKPKRGRGRGLGFGSTMLVLLLGFGGGVAGWYATDQWSDEGSSSASGDSGAVFQPSNEQSRSAERADAADAADGDQLTPRTIYQRLSPAVAHIDARIVKTETNFFGFEEEQEGSGTGSGFIIDEEGHIVTNAHVVEDAKELTVSLGVDNVKVPATLIGADPSSDIAIIKFDPDAKELEGVELSVAKFGDSTDLQVGDPVVAIGNPFGLDRTLTTGVVSALQRDIPALNDFRIGDVIQTDAAINPGNSGGPLLNSAGEVIGVNSQIQSRSGGFDGVAFAAPSSLVQGVAETLIRDGEVSYAWLGVEGGELTPELVEQLDLGDVTEGVYIANVSEGSPADKAGLEGGRRLQDLATGDTTVEGGDVVLKFDGERVSSMTQLGAIVDAKKPGDKVEVELIRGGDRKTVTVTLGDRSDQPSEPDSDG